MSQVENVNPVQETRDEKSSVGDFRPDIEGLRAVAVVAVILFHAGVPGAGGGFVGVDVFFVISGFLITGMLWREVSTTGSLRLGRFYGARARRLLPASALAGVATMIGSAVLLPPLEIRRVIGDGIASALYVGNYRFAQQGIAYLTSERPPSPFQHYWSLGVEEQFYLVWPPMILGATWLISRVRRRTDLSGSSSTRPYFILLLLVSAASFWASTWATHTAPPVAFFSLPTRAWQLAAGGIVALTAAQWRRLPASAATAVGAAGLALILLVCNQFSSRTAYPGTAALVPVLGAALVLGAGCSAPTQGLSRILASSPLRAIGRLSYSWYLWHWPVLLLVPAMLDRPVGLADRIAAVAISGGLAMLTMHLVENPLRYAASLRRSHLRSLAVGGLATAIAVCVGLVLLLVIPSPVGRSPAAQPVSITEDPLPADATIEQRIAAVQRVFLQVQAAVAMSAGVDDVPSNLDPSLTDAADQLTQRIFFNGCLRDSLQVGQPECAMGETDSPTTIALVGDSNAAMWAPGFERVATERHWRFELLAKAMCPFLDLPAFNPVLHRDYTECDQWRAQIAARLQSEHPKLIVLSASRRYGARDNGPSSFTSYDRAWLDSLRRTVEQLSATGARVLVLGTIPDPQIQVPSCLALHLYDATSCSAPTSTAMSELGISRETLSVEAGGGVFADLTGLFCTAERCPAVVGNSLVYSDRNHVTFEYARLMAPALSVLADRTMIRG